MTATIPGAGQTASVDAERVLLGGMMLAPSIIDEISRHIQPGMFYDPRHITIYKAIVAAADAGEPTDPVGITARLGAAIGTIGGAPYLLELIEQAPTTMQAKWYADRIASAALARGISALGSRTLELARTVAIDDPAGTIARIQAELDGLSVKPGDGDPIRWRDLANRGLAKIESAATRDPEGAPISTGLPDLDVLLGGGFRPGQFIVVGGRTSMGKSVAARNFARAAAFDQNVPTVLFSLEMSALEVFECILSAELRIDLTRIQEGDLSDNDWTRIARFLGETEDVPLWIDDTAGIGLSGIRGHCRTIQKQHGLGLVVIDYVQLVEAPNGRDNRQVAVSAITRGFKVMGGHFGVPVIACAQLNRGPEMRADKRPNVADFRESGSIENDANIIILVHREDYYNKQSPRSGEADFIVAKNRGGQTGDVVVAAQLHHSRFASMAVNL